MRVAFRVDASVQIGTGHAARCAALARALTARGHEALCVARHWAGAEDIPLTRLPPGTTAPDADGPAHAAWLGCAQAEDAAHTIEALAGQKVDWLIVDHYALDARWERAVAPHAGRIMAIDDLADRPHACALLLDQNLGRGAGDYRGLVPPGAALLIGPHFALLRPEFAAARPRALARRDGRLGHILVTMGGVDAGGVTGAVLDAIGPLGLAVTVVMGGGAPHLGAVRAQAEQWGARLVVDAPDMAALMAAADLAIGASGSTAWERCCLALPTLALVIADNQREAAAALAAGGAAEVVDAPAALPARLAHYQDNPAALAAMAAAAGAVTDGRGLSRVIDALEAAA
jgi:UDP-2,4-diacetamido-2,4,6-trideoxy-beta-L-altropyranose hydrolase